MVNYFPGAPIPYRPLTDDDDDDDDDNELNKVMMTGKEDMDSSINENKEYLCFRHYNPPEVLMGKTMAEWCQFSLCFWHTLNGSGGSDPFGTKTLQRPWDTPNAGSDGGTGTTTGSNDSNINNNNNANANANDSPMSIAKRRVDVLFDLLVKLNINYYTFHDTDIAPEGNTLQETFDNLDSIVQYIIDKQTKVHPELYGHIQLLWATQNLFSHARYMNGAMTNPNVNVYCIAAAQIKKVMDINFRLGGKNHVFWGGREGYQTLLNTNLKQECDQMAHMYRMAIQYKQDKHYTAQFLIEPKPCEPMKHQYDYDAATTMAFLYHYQLQHHFQLNIEPNHTTLAGHAHEHDVVYAAAFNMLGSIDANTGDAALGWDTDQFPMNVQETTSIMSTIVQMGGFTTGGLNFDCKVRRESVRPIDLLYGHVGAMDAYAYGLRKAIRIHERNVYSHLLQERYLTWTSNRTNTTTDTNIGPLILNGTATLDDCANHALLHNNTVEPPSTSGQQELYEIIRNTEIYYRK